MADIRINALATTAASTASDDFIAVDGSANGTRKLNAYSPTFGGNLTVSGTGNSSVAGNLGIGETSPVVPLHVKTTGTGTGDFDNAIATLRSTAAGRTITLQFSDTTNQSYISSKSGALNFGVGGAVLGMFLSSGGNLGIGTTNPNAKAAINGTADTGPTTNSNGILKVGDQTQTNGLIVGLYNSGTYGVYLQASDIRSGGGTPNYPIIVNPNGGNFLIGTNVDSSALLQVGTNTTTAAGGMKFGTDTGLYRIGTGWLALDSTGGDNPNLWFRESGSSKATVQSYLGDLYISTVTSGKSMYLRTDVNTTALTLDSSQRAIFSPARAASNLAVKIISSGAATNADRNFLLFGHNTAANAAVISQIDNTTTGAMSLILASGTDSTGAAAALTLDSSQNATFAGTSVTVDGASTGSTLTLKRASNANGAIISYKTTTTSKWYHGLRGLVDDNWYLQNDVAGNTALFFDASTSNATFAGAIAIGNTVNTVSPTSPNRTITMVIGGTTYYIHAKTTND